MLPTSMAQSLKVFVHLAATVALLWGCATTKNARRNDAKADAKVVQKSSSTKASPLPKNFSLFRTRDIDPKILRRGQKANGGSAFDSY